MQVDLAPVRGKKLLVALSGGADSVALLALLRAAGECGLAAAHFEHGIRGEASRADADFCRDLCAKWKVEYFEARADVPAEARRRGQGLETTARELRYAFLRETRLRAGADYIALGHHMDDQAETVLMHLLRGAGSGGMRGMQPLAGDLFRPLLGLRKRELVAYLQENGIPWREDATNASGGTPRNLLRLKGLPALETAYPQAVPAIARQAALARDEDDYMLQAAREWLRAHLQRGPYGLLLSADPAVHPAVFRRAVRLALDGIPDFAETEALLGLMRAPRGRLALSGGRRAERTASGLYLLPATPLQPPEAALNIPGTTELAGICRVVAEPWNGPPLRENGPVQTLDRAALAGAVLRTRRKGDRIRPLGLGGEKLLSDYLTDRRVDRPLRDVLPLLARGGQILWAVGIGIAAEAALRPGRQGARLAAEELS